MRISVANSRTAKKWKTVEMTWEQFVKRCSHTFRTAETMAEYRKLPKGQQDNIKDVGGFVGGELNGARKKDSVINRCLITLDADYADTDFWEDIELLFEYRCVVYSTHKHTPEKPRLRLIIPLSRPVTADEYAAIARRIAADVGIEQFDDTTYQPHRLMYWPSTSSDGEFVFKSKDGSLIDADSILTRYKNWKDTSEYPVSSRQRKILTHSIKKQQDPLEKRGIIGSFCRAYSITEAISEFLTDVYTPSSITGRYDYIPADSVAGVIVYNDKYAYSHHATDPACGKLCNAFDLVRIHKFGHLDKDEADNERSPSFKAMMSFAADNGKVKRQALTDKENEIDRDFTELPEDDEWKSKLEFDKKGNVKETLDNLVLILRHDDGLRSIAFNLHRDGIDARSGLPWEQIKDGWNDSDNAALKVYLSKKYGVYSPAKTKDAILAVAAERAYHPIKEYLEALPKWDGVKRVERLLIDYFGAENTVYTKAVIRKTLVAAIARIYTPGIKFDSVLILNGPQGIGKSTFFAKLAGKWFSDSLTLTDMKDKSGPEKLQGYWILELGELAGMRKTDVETVKSFLSRVDDKFRASYGVNVENHPRQCVIVGSTNNESGFLRDITGNRRFWPVRVSTNSAKSSWQLTDDEVRQIWAETMAIYRNGEKLYLEGEEEAAAVEEQTAAMETDEREGLVRSYLNMRLPENWDDMSIYDRRNYLGDSEFGAVKHNGNIERRTVCNMEIWCECFGKDGATIKKSDSYEIAAIMNKIGGWERGGMKVVPLYGKQRLYVKQD
ncbi:MAG: VapE domain-containing protein [Candidatus Ornithomonoglobus sp.]